MRFKWVITAASRSTCQKPWARPSTSVWCALLTLQQWQSVLRSQCWEGAGGLVFWDTLSMREVDLWNSVMKVKAFVKRKSTGLLSGTIENWKWSGKWETIRGRCCSGWADTCLWPLQKTILRVKMTGIKWHNICKNIGHCLPCCQSDTEPITKS